MQQTTNYQLNKWEKSDRILMEDFNRNFSKIDELFLEIPIKKLFDLSTETDAAEIDLDFSEIPLENFLELLIYVEPSAATTATGFSIRLNDLTDYYEAGATSITTDTYFAQCSLDRTKPERSFSRTHIFLGSRLSGACDYVCKGFSGMMVSSTSSNRIADLDARDVQYIRLYCSSSHIIGSGTRVRVLGVKK